MSEVGEKVRATVSLVGVAIVLVALLVGGRRVGTMSWLSPASVGIIVISAAGALSAVLAWWYIPFGRRPHRIPMWNDRFHRPGLRAVKATGAALALGILVTIGVYACMLSLLPSREGPGIETLPGGVVVRASANGGKGCSGTLTLQDEGWNDPVFPDTVLT